MDKGYRPPADELLEFLVEALERGGEKEEEGRGGEGKEGKKGQLLKKMFVVTDMDPDLASAGVKMKKKMWGKLLLELEEGERGGKGGGSCVCLECLDYENHFDLLLANFGLQVIFICIFIFIFPLFFFVFITLLLILNYLPSSFLLPLSPDATRS